MKHAIIIIILFLLIMNTEAQTSIQGASIQGATTSFGDQTLKNAGFVELWDAQSGFVMNGTNDIKFWNGRLGSSYSLRPSSPTNSPIYFTSFTTNAFPCVFFETNSTLQVGPATVKDYTIPKLFTGGKTITVVILECAEVTGVAQPIFSMGWTSATNANASLMRFGSHSTGAGTTQNLTIGFDTNQTVVNHTIGAVNVTNIYNWFMGSYSNGTTMVMQNLRASADVNTPGQLTLDTAVLGGFSRTNDSLSSIWKGGVTVIGISTNALIGTSATNTLNYLNNTYSNGKYKVY